MSTPTPAATPAIAALCAVLGVSPRTVFGLPADPAAQRRLLDAAVRSHLAGDPLPVPPIGRATIEHELRQLVRRAFNHVAALEEDARSAGGAAGALLDLLGAARDEGPAPGSKRRASR